MSAPMPRNQTINATAESEAAAKAAEPASREKSLRPRRGDRHRGLRRAASAALTLLTIWFAGFIAFVCMVSVLPAPPDELQTDGIVVLTGGAHRINTGLDLLRDGKGGKMLISGVDDRVSEQKLISLWQGGNEAPCCITLGKQARNTAENAKESAAWVAQENIRSLRLVTSGYHMPRAWLELRHLMPSVRLVIHPVGPGTTEADQKNFWLLAFPEYNKTLLVAAQHYLIPDFSKNGTAQ